jgi:Tfp pilus assembly protein PilN
MPIHGIVKAVNLLPPDTRGASKRTAELGARPEATGGAGPFVVLGVLAACVAGVAGYVLTNNTIKQREADLAAATAREQSVIREAAQLKPFADFDAETRGRVATVRDIAGSRFDWEQALRDLSRAVPADVTLKSLSGDINPTANTSGGGGSSSVRGAVQAPAITLKGCAPGQSQVAQLMARLRNIDGVTRVSLSKSDIQKYDSTLETGTSSADQLRNAAPCGLGKRPSFEIVAFFERADPATVAASTGTAGAAPTPTATPAAGATPSASPTPAGSSADATNSTGGTTP